MNKDKVIDNLNKLSDKNFIEIIRNYEQIIKIIEKQEKLVLFCSNSKNITNLLIIFSNYSYCTKNFILSLPFSTIDKNSYLFYN